MRSPLGVRDRAADATAALLARATGRLLALPGWAQVLLLYAATRLVTALVTARVAAWQAASLWTTAHPSYGAFVAEQWDATWYRNIAERGYPLPLPLGDDGAPRQSEWAFFPAYPLLVRAVLAVSGLPWRVAAPATSVVVGAAAALVLHRLFRDAAARAGLRDPGALALGALALVLVFPSSPVLQYAYTESLALLAVAAGLLALLHRRYGWCALAVLLLGATRAVALPFAAVVAVHAAARWRARAHDPFPVRQRLAVLGLGAVSVVAGLAWPVAVGLLTGRPDAYTQVQAAWRGQQVTWLLPWVAGSQRVGGTVAGPVLLVLLVAGLVAWCTGRRSRALGVELPAWVLAYTVHLLLVVDPWTSTFRFWLLQAPLALVLVVRLRTRGHLATWVGASLALQVVWVAWLWRFSPPADVPP